MLKKTDSMPFSVCTVELSDEVSVSSFSFTLTIIDILKKQSFKE